MSIKEIEHKIEAIINGYKTTLFPKRYISDSYYLQLTKELEYLKTIQDQKKQRKEKRDSYSFNMNQERFESLSKEIQIMILEENYDYLKDPDNILNWYPQKRTEFSNKVMETRLKSIKDLILRQMKEKL